MSRRKRASSSELITDPGVLYSTPTLEVFDDRAVTAVGGTAVLPHRGRWLRAVQQGLDSVGWFGDVSNRRFTQAVVHLQKGKAATEAALAEVWRRLEPGGRLLLVGGNELGVRSAVKRLSTVLGAPAEIVANRAHARVAAWQRTDLELPRPEVVSPTLNTPRGAVALRSFPGVFSADEIDPGTAMLLDSLDRLPAPSTVFDPGCGIGVLGLAALLRWPEASAVLAEVDHRAFTCAERNVEDLGLVARCRTLWWDAQSEPPPLQRCDLALVNPPFHSGVPVDLQPARAIFRALGSVLSPGGLALIVANRTLPWERDLAELGRLRKVAEAAGYKILEIAR